ncbi:4-hydroxy-tetrahydrodipicolinate synthase [Halanaerobium saccharolyticum]|uniref:4-hydroxy-tetrahydrodipicolinate synthase n=1 Tax=Halanaerobium saccharolyticum TaxID=43595 RepID=A0A4R7YXW8_9FIRM|nr:4-hydroxy-tetrahydrodipicolinate synthase [Halanaerobium saccharolyticum]RAK07194.1 4-hydroxy-tetrahydrodipicolinate synthase [Halanaerobium saccharolyticum]TDW02107.1 4-hydroxy-tetrahydrodipicolinate synthase [Halanaerobium saccharolyticum]TDX58838.1 4-hydroxy-tetrahydrodipicolinate synthase [Halanaerobium saccharolyticum]
MIKGIITPTITVFDENKNNDYKATKEHIENLIQGGVNGILFLGSIGEFFAMTLKEKKELISFAVQIVANRVPVLVGTGGTAAEDVIELSNFARKEGVDGAAVITPYFFQFNQQILYNYYSYIAKNVDLDLYLYNFPARSGVNISAETVFKLAKNYNNIVGIKDTLDTISHTRELIQKVKLTLDREFAVYSGFDEYFLPNLLNGGNGLIGGLSNVAPQLFTEFYNSYQKNDFSKLKLISRKINIMMGIYSVSDPFFPAIKKAVSLSGSNLNAVCKEPVGLLNNEQTLKIKRILREAELI